MRWLAVRLDVISVALITITALMIVLMHGQIPPAYAGLAISYAVQVSGSCVNVVFLCLLTLVLFQTHTTLVIFETQIKIKPERFLSHHWNDR